MNPISMLTSAAARLCRPVGSALLLTAVVAVVAVVPSAEVPSARSSAAGGVADAAAAEVASSNSIVVTDARGDVTPRTLDLTSVRVTNEFDRLTVRVSFPGVKRRFDFPTGAVTVFLDTDAAHPGPEYGHFMDFWSDYRFARAGNWREHPTRAWGHDPEGRCVGTAGLESDRRHRLRWFRFTVAKSAGCFDPTGAVRVAVSAVNTGDLDPHRTYPAPVVDHLGARRSWTAWVPVAP